MKVPRKKRKSTEPAKKRGRKPKGGKIVAKAMNIDQEIAASKPNIILHLKCSRAELGMNRGGFFSQLINVPKGSDVKAFEANSHGQATVNYDLISDFCSKKIDSPTHNHHSDGIRCPPMERIWAKLKILKTALRNNDIPNKKSACFWCTYSFQGPPVHIPKCIRNETVEVYGCFCTPECAVAFLKKESIDSSTLWERYALLNTVYSKIYQYKASIKPAPDPYYTLERYYGSLSIEEYRTLLHSKPLLLVTERPLAKIHPELYEENDVLPSIHTNLLHQKTKPKIKDFRLSRKCKRYTKQSYMKSNFKFTTTS